MRIAIIGTSNSILRGGYVAGIEKFPGVFVKNMSRGASTTVLLPALVKKHDYGQYDYIVFDFGVNEEAWVRAGTTTLAQIQDNIETFLSCIHASNAVPVFCILARRDGISAELPVRRFYREFARTRGFPCFDSYEFLAERFPSSSSSPPVFLDDEHLSREIAYQFGAHVAASLSSRQGCSSTRELKIVRCRRTEFVNYSQMETDSLHIVTRTSSLVDESFVQLSGTQAVRVNFPSASEIVGIAINRAQSRGGLRIVSGGVVSKCLWNDHNYKGDDHSLIYSVFPIKNLPGSSFLLSPGEQDAVVELNGIVVRRDEEELAYWVLSF